jgi:hypothetical protein
MLKCFNCAEGNAGLAVLHIDEWLPQLHAEYLHFHKSTPKRLPSLRGLYSAWMRGARSPSIVPWQRRATFMAAMYYELLEVELHIISLAPGSARDADVETKRGLALCRMSHRRVTDALVDPRLTVLELRGSTWEPGFETCERIRQGKGMLKPSGADSSVDVESLLLGENDILLAENISLDDWQSDEEMDNANLGNRHSDNEGDDDPGLARHCNLPRTPLVFQEGDEDEPDVGGAPAHMDVDVESVSRLLLSWAATSPLEGHTSQMGKEYDDSMSVAEITLALQDWLPESGSTLASMELDEAAVSSALERLHRQVVEDGEPNGIERGPYKVPIPGRGRQREYLYRVRAVSEYVTHDQIGSSAALHAEMLRCLAPRRVPVSSAFVLAAPNTHCLHTQVAEGCLQHLRAAAAIPPSRQC